MDCPQHDCLERASPSGLFSTTSTTNQAGETNGGDFYCYNWWVSANYGDTVFTTFYPINPQQKINTGYSDSNTGDALVLSASSFHPGGANFAFADGSVKFIKDTVQCWQLVSNGGNLVPTGFTYSGSLFTPAGIIAQMGAVYQKLSTRNGGELVGSDRLLRLHHGGPRTSGSCRKDCHRGFGLATAARSFPGLARVEVYGRHLTSHRAAHGHLCQQTRSPLVELVHQGSDPTLPHQTLGDPTERQAFLKASKRHGDGRRCSGHGPARSGGVGLP